MNNEQAKEIMKRITTDTLRIARIPEQTEKAFKELAKEQFCDDYGMTLKFLVDGIVNIKEQEVLERLMHLENEINILKQQRTEEPEDEKTIRMCDGTTRKGK